MVLFAAHFIRFDYLADQTQNLPFDHGKCLAVSYWFSALLVLFELA
jgi:hypothetical protein